MKFDLGKTWEEYLEEQAQWHDFFAVLPRKISDHDYRCFETIQRRRTWVVFCPFVHVLLPSEGWSTEYRTKGPSHEHL